MSDVKFPGATTRHVLISRRFAANRSTVRTFKAASAVLSRRKAAVSRHEKILITNEMQKISNLDEQKCSVDLIFFSVGFSET